MATYKKKMFKILVTHPEVPKEALQLLQKTCELIILKSVPPNRGEIMRSSNGVDAIFWASHDKLNAEALDAAGPELKVISTMSAGLDYVDIEEVKKRNIPLGHTPKVLNGAVADVAIGLMIAAARRFHEGRRSIEAAQWETFHLNWMLGTNIENKTVGFLGFGGVGIEIARRLKGFNIARIIYTKRTSASAEIEEEFCATKVPFVELLSQSDIIFIVCPLTEETRNIFDTGAFDKMKNTAILVNVARGQIVDQMALYNALNTKTIYAAGIDVMNPEPMSACDPMLCLPNCVITPHIGSATLATRTNMAVLAAHNILQGLAGEPLIAPAYK